MRFDSPADLPPTHGYSQVVTVPAGTQVWVSGQGIEAQARLAFRNVGRALASAGASWAGVFKLTIFVTDIAAVPTVRAVRDEVVDTGAPPASSLVEVGALVRPELLIEIEAFALLS
jgi:enamine deaminase RidA (YjgF/YER057c/UK114 family)